MSILNGLARMWARRKGGLDSGSEFLIVCTGHAITKVGRLIDSLYGKTHTKRLIRKFRCNDMSYRIKEVRLPALDAEREHLFLSCIFEDTFASYVYFDDKYEASIDLEKILDEGAYGLVGEGVDVRVKPGDIVIDAGSWIGDFAAYASAKGAVCYAFEPSEENYKYLEKTAELNSNIIPVRKGLSDENTSMTLYVNIDGNSGGNSLLPKTTEKQKVSSAVETIRLDDFVRENNIPRVDFIKADIEGFERHMLAGAQETLARFAPKLALCTYHLPDDPEVMAALIKQANPRYNIVQKRKKLFASVPED